MHAVLGAADARGETVVGLLGNPAYYSRFGFDIASTTAVTSPDPAWGDYFQIRTLWDYNGTGASSTQVHSTGSDQSVRIHAQALWC